MTLRLLRRTLSNILTRAQAFDDREPEIGEIGRIDLPPSGEKRIERDGIGHLGQFLAGVLGKLDDSVPALGHSQDAPQRTAAVLLQKRAATPFAAIINSSMSSLGAVLRQYQGLQVDQSTVLIAPPDPQPSRTAARLCSSSPTSQRQPPQRSSHPNHDNAAAAAAHHRRRRRLSKPTRQQRHQLDPPPLTTISTHHRATQTLPEKPVASPATSKFTTISNLSPGTTTTLFL